MPLSTDPLQSKILIVDDQDSNVRLLEFALRREGYLAVTSTTQSATVCALHHDNRYDLLLLDLQMPHPNGFEVLAALANEPPVAVLVLSADPTQQAAVLEAGAKGFLSKPFVLTEMQAMVRRMLPPKIEEPLPAVVRIPGAAILRALAIV
jgi:CheY-like chemotaxis protein